MTEFDQRPMADRCACGYCHSCNLRNPDCTCRKPSERHTNIAQYMGVTHGSR